MEGLISSHSHCRPAAFPGPGTLYLTPPGASPSLILGRGASSLCVKNEGCWTLPRVNESDSGKRPRSHFGL